MPLYNGHLFFVPVNIKSIHSLFYNGHLFTTDTFFHPQGGRCREAQLYLHFSLSLLHFSTHLCIVCHLFSCLYSYFTVSSHMNLLLEFYPNRTLETHYNESLYNKFLGITNDFVYPNNSQIQWNPALQPPRWYGHLVIMATFFWQSGIMALHFLVKKTLVNTVTR